MYHSIQFYFPVIDHIIGCGQRNGIKYFLVRFKGATANEIIDWNEAKNYAVDVMEYFGSRLQWSTLDDDDNVDDTEDDQQQNQDHVASAIDNASASLLDNPINAIDFAQ